MGVNWHDMLALTMSPLELMIRGTAVYWFLFLIFRFLLKRDVGAVGIADVLLLVIIADAAQNAMAGEYKSVSDGFVLIGTIVGWNYGLDRLAFRFRAVRRFVEASPLMLVRDGRILRRNMRREMITDEDLRAKLREHGIDDLAEVRNAFMESDGEISVIKRKPGDAAEKPQRPRLH